MKLITLLTCAVFQVTTELTSEYCADFILVSAKTSRLTVHQLASIADSLSSVVNNILFAYDQIN